MQERIEGFLLRFGQWCHKRPNGGETPLQEFLAEGSAPLGQVKGDGTPVASFPALDETVGCKPIDETHGSRMRQAKYASQPVVGRAKAISDDDQGCGRFTGATEDCARRLLDAIDDGKPDGTEQIGSAVDHPSTICAARTCFNLTICAART